MEPIFKDFYADKYDKEEFLIDAGFEFSKLKNLLTKNPKVLRDDPILSLDYFKIIQLLRQTNVLEATEDPFKSVDNVRKNWHDPELIERQRIEREAAAIARYMRNSVLEGSVSGE